MRAVLRGGLALLVAVGPLLVAAPAAAAEDPVVGTWTRTNPGLAVALPPANPAPEGGGWVSGEPTGPVAVTALRGSADPGQVVTGLRLAVADTAGPVSLLVCPTLDRWVAERAGRIEAAPPVDCAVPVPAVVQGEELVVDLPVLLHRRDLDVLLAPAPDSAFSLTFERPTAASLVQAPASTSTTSPVLAPAPPLSTEGLTPDAFAPALPPFEAGPVAAPLLPELPAPAAPVAAAPVPQPQTAAVAPSGPVALRRAPAAPPVDRTGALVAAALLAGLGALALQLGRQPATAPQRLGGAARLVGVPSTGPAPEAPVRGVGRFRSARASRPVRL